jgi:zinc transport system ATP-binding protein
MQTSAHHDSDCGLCRIALDGVTLTAGSDTLLHDISFHIHCGQITALVGPNGAGKTTLIRALLKQVSFTGSIRHMDAHDRDFSGLRTGYVPQQMPFDRQMPVTVQDLLASSLGLFPVWLGITRSMRSIVKEALCLAHAESLAKKRLGMLSGGELQRVLLALALSPLPDLLVLDEPVSGVDQNGLSLFLETIRTLRDTHHMAIILVSHDWTMVEKYADHVILLDKTVLAKGMPKEVFSSVAFRTAFPISYLEGGS